MVDQWIDEKLSYQRDWNCYFRQRRPASDALWRLVPEFDEEFDLPRERIALGRQAGKYFLQLIEVVETIREIS